MNDPALIGGIVGGLGGIATCGILIMRFACPTLFARSFGMASDAPPAPPVLRIRTPKERPIKVYRSKELTRSRRVTA